MAEPPTDMGDPPTQRLDGPPTAHMPVPPAGEPAPAPPPDRGAIVRRTHRGGGWRRFKPALVVLGVLLVAAVVIRFAVGGGGESAAAALGPPPEVPAAAYAVLDGRSQEIIAGRDEDARRPVASLTKMMTAYLALRAGSPEHLVTVPPLALASDESNIRLRPGETQRRDVLIRAMMIVSAGDAADALATDVAGSIPSFVDRMNATAADLGLGDTHYANASGLDDPDGLSSARDSVRLAFRLMQIPSFREMAVRRSASLHGERFPATNRLVGSYPGADGVKTGFTDGAGWCIVASAWRDGRRVYVAVLGAPDQDARDRAARALLDWALSGG